MTLYAGILPEDASTRGIQWLSIQSAKCPGSRTLDPQRRQLVCSSAPPFCHVLPKTTAEPRECARANHLQVGRINISTSPRRLTITPKERKANMKKPADAKLICVMCSKSATRRCRQCQSQIYCSSQCEKSDERVHSLLCSSYKEFKTPPHKNARRAIVFEQNEPVIRFKWVSIEKKKGDEPGDPCSETPILKEYFEPSVGGCQPYYNNVIRDRRLRNMIDLRFRDFFLTDGSPPNQAVAAVAPAVGGDVWRGPLIALKWSTHNNGLFLSNPTYGHMDMGDLREVVDYLVTYGRHIHVPYQLDLRAHGGGGLLGNPLLLIAGVALTLCAILYWYM